MKPTPGPGTAESRPSASPSSGTRRPAGRSPLLRSIPLALLGMTGGAVQGEVTVQLVSADAAGVPGNDLSFNPAISGDGRLVAFESRADNLVPGDTNGVGDVFVKDTGTGEIVRASVNAAGVQGNGSSSGFGSGIGISADGRFVAFTSSATNLVPGDTNRVTDVFVKDLETGDVRRASEDAAGEPGNADSESPSLDSSGSRVLFESFASNLVAGDTNMTLDMFVKNLATGEIVRASEGARGEQGSSDNAGGGISADGRLVAFPSFSSLVPEDTDGTGDVFVKNLETGAILRASESATGESGNGESRARPALSGDGRFVAFDSVSSDLVPGDTNGFTDVFVKDIETGAIERASEDAMGVEGDADSGDFDKSISADGRVVSFSSAASNLVPNDTNEVRDVFVKDLRTGEIERVSEGPGGAGLGRQGNDRSLGSGISASGRFVAFVSEASNLVPEDSNGSADVFLADVDGVNAPTAPGNLRFAVYSRTAAEIFWDRSSDNGSVLYEVVRNGQPAGVVDALGVFEDALRPGTSYTYDVTAIDDDGNRSATATVGFTTRGEPAPSGIPSAPGGFRYAVYSRTAAELFWNRSGDDGRIVGYDITRNGILVETRDAASYFDDSLSPGIDYTYTVAAVDDEGNRSAVRSVSFATRGDGSLSENPSTPSGFRVAVYSRTAAELFWNRSSDNGRVVGYDLTRNGVLVETRDATSYFDDDLSPGESYTYRIVAVDDEGNRSASRSIDVSTAPR